MLKFILIFYGIQLLVGLVFFTFKFIERRREAKKEKTEFEKYKKY